MSNYSWFRSVVHELVHLLLHIKLNGKRVPLYFEEGVAVALDRYWLWHRIPGLTLLQKAALGLARRQKGVPTKEWFSKPFYHLDNQIIVDAAFAFCQLYVAYLVKEAGLDSISRILDRVSEGVDFGQAVFEVTGKKEWYFFSAARYLARKESSLRLKDLALYHYAGGMDVGLARRRVLEQMRLKEITGALLASQNKYESALYIYTAVRDRMLQMQPEWVSRVAKLLVGLGRLQQAYELANQALEAFEDDPRLWYIKSLTLKGMNRKWKKEAVVAFLYMPSAQETTKLLLEATDNHPLPDAIADLLEMTR